MRTGKVTVATCCTFQWTYYDGIMELFRYLPEADQITDAYVIWTRLELWSYVVLEQIQ